MGPRLHTSRSAEILGVCASTALLAAACLAGCGGTADARRPPTDAVGERALPAVAPTPALLRALADGTERFDAHVDPARGVLFVEVFTDASGEDPRADASGEVKLAERLCGAALTARLERLALDLRTRFESADGEEVVTCAEDTCRHSAAMEYDSDGALVFRAGAGGALVLDRVVRTEGGPVTEEWRAGAERWASEQVSALGSGTCGP
jgi:hypothetical protein